MKKVSFRLTVNWEGRTDGPEKLELTDEIEIPYHCTDLSLGFKTFEFGRLLFNLYLLTFCKGIGYGDSWRKRGEIRGIAANIDRKYDRLSNSFSDMEVHAHNDPGPRIDGAGDLLVYCGLYLSSWVTEKYPALFKKWWEEDLTRFIDTFRRNPKYDTQNLTHDDSGDGEISKAAFSAETPPGNGVAA
jgi:hypothetical protein